MYDQIELCKKKIEWLLKNGTSKNKNEDDAARHVNNAEKCLRWTWVATEMPGHSYRYRNMMQRCGCQYAHESFSTDLKLLNKVIDFCHGVADKESLKVRQIYVRELKELKLIQRFRGRKNSKTKVRKTDKLMHTITGRNRACYRALKDRPSVREELQQGSLLRLHQCHTCSCRI